MDDAHNFFQYGAWGALAYVVVKWVLPNLNASSSKAAAERGVYDQARDSMEYAHEQLDKLRARHEQLRKELDEMKALFLKEQSKRLEIEKQRDSLLEELNARK